MGAPMIACFSPVGKVTNGFRLAGGGGGGLPPGAGLGPPPLSPPPPPPHAARDSAASNNQARADRRTRYPFFIIVRRIQTAGNPPADGWANRGPGQERQ